MQKWKQLALAGLVGSSLALSGCVYSMAPTAGSLYTDVSGGFAATGEHSASKVGTAETMGVVGFAFGDASISTAMSNGGISQIHHVDYHTTNVLGLFTRHKLMVYGE